MDRPKKKFALPVDKCVKVCILGQGISFAFGITKTKTINKGTNKMKDARNMKGPKNTTAWALLKNGQMAGRLVASWSDNPAGSVCTVWFALYSFGKGETICGMGSAGGYGYDKLSASTYRALKDAGLSPKIVQPANSLTKQEFEAMGYTVVEVL